MLLPIPGDWVKGMAHGAGRPPCVANVTHDEESVVGPPQVVVQVRGRGYGGVTTSGHVAVAMRGTGALPSLPKKKGHHAGAAGAVTGCTVGASCVCALALALIESI